MKNLIVIFVFLTLLTCKNETGANTDFKELNELAETEYIGKLQDTKLFAGRLVRFDSFPSKFITPRPVDVWLPKNYSNEKKYSVLYMHDGQMLFDSTTTWNKQEWKVDEWASTLMEDEKTKDFIVVAIHNIPQIRWQDLFPQKAFEPIDKSVHEQLLSEAINADVDSKLNGDNYLKFIVEELKPIIDSSYAVYTDRGNTFVMGSSMGGLMSMYAISEYPEIFAGAGCLSTHWPGATPQPNNPFAKAIFNYMEANLPEAGAHKLYFDYGNKTLDQYYPQYASRVDEILIKKGYTTNDSKNLFFEGTDHSENSWNKRLDQPLTFLLSFK